MVNSIKQNIKKSKLKNIDSLEYWKNKSAEEKFKEVDRLIDQHLAKQGKSRQPELLRQISRIKRYPEE